VAEAPWMPELAVENDVSGQYYDVDFFVGKEQDLLPYSLLPVQPFSS